MAQRPVELHPDEEVYQQMLRGRSKKIRKREEGYIHMENKRMRCEDQRTTVVRRIEHSDAQSSTVQAELAKAQAQSSTVQAELAKAQEDLARAQEMLAEQRGQAVQPPPPQFSVGQSVHQFWAKWMAGCSEIPEKVNKKTGRPAWYSGQINAPPVWRTIAYGGVVKEAWGYVVH